jgi:amino acid transporter
LSNQHDEDAKLLESLGYKQEFNRRWSGFSNFAISFSIISVLSGCFTTFGQAWNNGGPIAISIGWPVISIFILIIALCMAELVSAMPTAGGIFYWAFALGKPVHGWLTGWLNLIGLVAVIAGVDYGFATFFTTTMSLFNDAWDPTNLKLVFVVFMVTVLLHILINIYGAKVINLLQNINVYWHVFGVAAILGILIFLPKSHQSVEWVFTTQNNNSGFSQSMYWWYVLPLGFLLTQYTITGFDASAHVSEETGGASKAAAKGMWQSVAFSAIGGWLLLLSFLFAATDVDALNKAGGFAPAIFESALTPGWTASRMLFAFSRDRAVPGHQYWTKLDSNKNPSHAAFGVGFFALVLTLPALWAPEGTVVPIAFFAVTSVTVLGLFLSFMIPIYLRWKQGDHFKVGAWNLGKHYKWMAPIAVIEIIYISIVLCLPTTPAGVPWNENFTWLSVQYAPIALLVIIGSAMTWWYASAKNWFKAPEHRARLVE